MTCYDACRQNQQSLDLNTEPASIDEELTRVGVQISRLAVRAGRRNQRRSPIYTLPPELLAVIFLFTCTSEGASWEKIGKPTRQALVLSTVSSYLRQVVLDTPSLWNTATLEVRERVSETKAALLEHHFTHAKHLDVSLDLLAARGRTTHAKLCQVANILFAPENAQKITILRVKCLPEEWVALLSQLPRLHTLVLENLENDCYAPLPLVDLRTQPLLRLFISFDGKPYNWGSANLPSSVQEFVTYGAGCNILFESLRQCPNLTRAIHKNAYEDRRTRYFTTPLTLGHLETLTWPAWSLDLSSVQNLSLPALKHLCLELDGPESPYSRRSVTIFCHQLSETLASLELDCFNGWGVDDLRRLFLHKLERLEILKLTHWRLSQLVVATRVLTPSAEEFGRNELPMLPSLRSLVLKVGPPSAYYGYRDDNSRLAAVLPCYSENRTHTDETVSLFLDLLKKRRAGEITPFRLDLPGLLSREQKLGWSDRQREVFRYAIGALKWSDKQREVFRRGIGTQCIEVLQGGKVLQL